jgi:hypothetical protein
VDARHKAGHDELEVRGVGATPSPYGGDLSLASFHNRKREAN